MSWFKTPDNLAALSDSDLGELHLTIQKHMKILRYAVSLTVLLIIVGYAFSIYSTVTAVSSEEFGTAFERRGAILMPKVQKALMDVGHNVSTPVGEALANEVEDLMAGFSGKLNQEMTKMKETLPTQMEGLLLRQMKDARDKQVATLETEFPALKDDPKKLRALMESFEMAFARWAQRMLVRHFNRHMKDLENIKRSLNGFVAQQNAAIADSRKTAIGSGGAVSAKGARVSPEHLLGLWLEIMEKSIEGDGPIDLLKDPTEKAAK